MSYDPCCIALLALCNHRAVLYNMFHLPFSSTCIHLPTYMVPGKMPCVWISWSSKACTCTRVTTFSAISLLCVLTYLMVQPEVDKFHRWLLSVDTVSSCVIFLLLFTVTSFPVTWGYIMVNFAAGYRFGVCVGYLVTVVCVVCGSLVSFCMCRILCGSWLTPRLQSDHSRAIMTVVEGEEGFRVIALTRLTPIPFGLQNGMFAMTKVSTATFMSASFLGLLPTQALNAYFGATLRSAQDISDQQSYSSIFLVFQIAVSIFLSIYIVNLAQRRLRTKLENENCKEGGMNSSGPILPLLSPPKNPLLELDSKIPGNRPGGGNVFLREPQELKVAS